MAVELNPWVEYEFRVVATNKIGTGDPSVPSRVIRTNEAGKNMNSQKLIFLEPSGSRKSLIIMYCSTSCSPLCSGTTKTDVIFKEKVWPLLSVFYKQQACCPLLCYSSILWGFLSSSPFFIRLFQDFFVTTYFS